MMKAVCLLSGGMDSSTLAYVAKKMEWHPRPPPELRTADRTKGTDKRKKDRITPEPEAFVEIDLDYFTKFGASSLTDEKIAVEEYDPKRLHMPNTYVPFRNANLLSIATSFAEAREADAIFIGVQSLDYSGYPDCRPQFIEAFQRVIDLEQKTRQKSPSLPSSI